MIARAAGSLLGEGAGRIEDDSHEPAPSFPVSAEAQNLHRNAVIEAGAGRYEEAIGSFERAMALAPEWPQPAYELGRVYLLVGDMEAAEACYRRCDRLFPHGYFSAKGYLDSLRRERRGVVPGGATRALVELEWVRVTDDRRDLLQSLAEWAPNLPLAWLELAKMVPGPERRRAIQAGLELDPDPDTRGKLLVELALALREHGDTPQALRVLTSIASDPAIPKSAGMHARLLLSTLAPELMAEPH